MSKNLFSRYIWLVDTIYRSKRITFEEINNKWQHYPYNDGEPFPLRTFHNHREKIETIFDIDIACDLSTYEYYIENSDDIDNDTLKRWLFDTFSINNLIHESQEIKDRIILENIPSGQVFLAEIVRAIRENLKIEVAYQSHWKDYPTTFDIEPYCVKIFNNIWYVVGRSPYYDKIMIYAFDRIQKLNISIEKFDYPESFDPKSFFRHSYGIIVDQEVDAAFVVFKVFGSQVKYIRSLPLHSSMEEIETYEGYSTFRCYIKPSYDFIQKILSLGNNIEMLEPVWLRDEICSITQEMYSIYKNREH